MEANILLLLVANQPNATLFLVTLLSAVIGLMPATWGYLSLREAVKQNDKAEIRTQLKTMIAGIALILLGWPATLLIAIMIAINVIVVCAKAVYMLFQED